MRVVVLHASQPGNASVRAHQRHGDPVSEGGGPTRLPVPSVEICRLRRQIKLVVAQRSLRHHWRRARSARGAHPSGCRAPGLQAPGRSLGVSAFARERGHSIDLERRVHLRPLTARSGRERVSLAAVGRRGGARGSRVALPTAEGARDARARRAGHRIPTSAYEIVLAACGRGTGRGNARPRAAADHRHGRANGALRRRWRRYGYKCAGGVGDSFVAAEGGTRGGGGGRNATHRRPVTVRASEREGRAGLVAGGPAVCGTGRKRPLRTKWRRRVGWRSCGSVGLRRARRRRWRGPGVAHCVRLALP